MNKSYSAEIKYIIEKETDDNCSLAIISDIDGKISNSIINNAGEYNSLKKIINNFVRANIDCEQIKYIIEDFLE